MMTSENLAWLLIGIIAGGVFGVGIMCLMQVVKDMEDE